MLSQVRWNDGVFRCRLQLYRANMPLSRDIRALYRLSKGSLVIRVSLWDRYVAYSNPFEVKAKQGTDEPTIPVRLKEFIDTTLHPEAYLDASVMPPVTPSPSSFSPDGTAGLGDAVAGAASDLSE